MLYPDGLVTHRRKILMFATAWLTSACVTSEPLRPGDHAVLVTADRLAEFGLVLPLQHEASESFERQRVVGTVMIEYEFSRRDQEPPFVYSKAELHSSAAAACRSFSAGNFGIVLGGLELREPEDFFQYGQKSRFGVIESGGTPVGNFFNMCQSRTALLVMFVGIYFEEPAAWEALIQPHLRALVALEASSP